MGNNVKRNTFGADADEDVTDWGEVNMEEKRLAAEAQFIEWRKDPMRRKLAETIHNSWSVEPFDEVRDTEDWTTAQAVIEAFPQICQG